MDEPLYNSQLLRLAASLGCPRDLENAQASVERVSPVCGSRVRVSLSLDAGGRVCAFAQQVHACALGQASAAILETAIARRDAGALRRAHQALARWLAQGGAVPSDLAGFAGIELLAPAHAYPGRHPSILLAFDAAASAAEIASVQPSGRD
jgi:NifU-like protein involved in Fe-S cluster formation